MHKLEEVYNKKAAETANAEPEAEAEAEDDEWSSDAEEVSWTDDHMYTFSKTIAPSMAWCATAKRRSNVAKIPMIGHMASRCLC